MYIHNEVIVILFKHTKAWFKTMEEVVWGSFFEFSLLYRLTIWCYTKLRATTCSRELLYYVLFCCDNVFMLPFWPGLSLKKKKKSVICDNFTETEVKWMRMQSLTWMLNLEISNPTKDIFSQVLHWPIILCDENIPKEIKASHQLRALNWTSHSLVCNLAKLE